MKWTEMDARKASQVFYAATIFGIGVTGLIGGGFAPIWQPVPETTPFREFLAYLGTFVLLASGIGLLVKRTAAPAALALLVYLLIWTLLFKVPFILRDPLVEVSYQTNGENAAYIAGAWIIYCWLAPQTKGMPGYVAGNGGLRIARTLYGLGLIAFGFSHFAYLQLTAPLVPAWLGAPVFWAYLAGIIYIATGITIVTGFLAPLGALVAALQITLITVLVWGPMVLAGRMSAGHWQETIVSWAITAGAWVVAASYAGHGSPPRMHQDRKLQRSHGSSSAA